MKPGDPGPIISMKAVAKAIELLQGYLPGIQNPAPVQYNPGDLRSQWIGDAVSTLRALEIALSTKSHGQTMNGLEMMAETDVPPTTNVLQVVTSQSLAALDAWNTNALESLNNFDNFDWIWGDMTTFT